MLKAYEVEYFIETKDRGKFHIGWGHWYFESALARPEDEPPYGTDANVIMVSRRGGEERSFLIDPEKQEHTAIWSFRL